MVQRRRPVRTGTLWLAGLAVLLVAVPSLAWRQYHTKDSQAACAGNPEACGCGLRWYSNQVDYKIDDTGLTGVSNAELQTTVAAAFGAWQSVQCTLCPSSAGPGCPPVNCAPNPLSIKLNDVGFGAPTPVGATCMKLDPTGQTCLDITSNGNFILVIKDHEQWQQASGQSQFVFALTILTYNRQTGAIADADILLDAADFDFCVKDCPADSNNLCNTLTHEAGHFLGLDHSSDPDATMYATAPTGETRKCTLHDDDRMGICTAYRTACSSQGCPEVDKGGLCSAARTGGGVGATAWLALAPLLLIGLRRRRVA